jgi:hypothetical protein
MDVPTRYLSSRSIVRDSGTLANVPIVGLALWLGRQQRYGMVDSGICP